MGQPKSPSQPKERRLNNVHEVVLGFGKKQIVEEARRCPQCAQPSCLNGCPLGIDIPGFIRMLREDDAVGALERIRQKNPFPAICGRICPAPCEAACIFNDEGAPIAIRSLERYAADAGRPKNKKDRLVPTGKGIKVAIIGGGPSGLAAAYYLINQGFLVTVFEACDEPGGLLRYGIPEFRLPQKVLDEQIQELEALGVVFQCNAFVGQTILIPEIMQQGYAAVLLAIGAGVSDFADIVGHNLGGVYYAEEFLMRVQMVGKSKGFDDASRLVYGAETAVIGWGSSALDAARMVVRLGQKVHLIFGGLEEELGVHADDLKDALLEGVEIKTLVEPILLEGNAQSFVTGVLCQKLEVVEHEEKFVLEHVVDSKHLIDAQTVILSHGRRPNSFLAKHLPLLRWNNDRTIWTDALTGQTSIERIFAAGNVVTGAGQVVDAIASGKKAAQRIMEFCLPVAKA